MKSWVGRFCKDERGTTFEGIALSVSVLAVAFVASADMLDRMTKPHDGPNQTIAFRPIPTTGPRAELDETPTGSLPKLISHSVLDPCTGQVK